MVRFIGAKQRHGPVAPHESAEIERNDLVRVVNGLVVAVAAGAQANLAVALEPFPDPEYEEGALAKPMIDLALLGEDFDVEIPFVTTDSDGILQTHIAPTVGYDITADGVVNLESTTQGVFRIRRLGDGTQFGDLTGEVIGVFNDAAAL